MNDADADVDDDVYIQGKQDYCHVEPFIHFSSHKKDGNNLILYNFSMPSYRFVKFCFRKAGKGFWSCSYKFNKIMIESKYLLRSLEKLKG